MMHNALQAIDDLDLPNVKSSKGRMGVTKLRIVLMWQEMNFKKIYKKK